MLDGIGLRCGLRAGGLDRRCGTRGTAPALRRAHHCSAALGRPRFGPRPGQGFWTPRAADLRRLEAGLPRSLTGYYRQYVGITQGGKRLILINGFKAGVAPAFTGGQGDWHRHAVIVSDGGDDFFQATYDPHTRQFVGPEFNGQG